MRDDLNILVPIRTVCAMYNLNPNTLRTWERRYGIITPKRSEGGHRAFGQDDLDNIETMIALMNEGLAPSEAAERVRRPAGAQKTVESPRTSELRQRFHRAIQQLDSHEAIQACHRAVGQLGYQAAVEFVLFPELVHWGHQWESGAGDNPVAREHMATLAVRSILIARQQELMPKATGLPVTLACVPGEQHDLPILHVANILIDAGVGKPVVFVAGLPLESILDASAAARSRAIVLSATLSPRSAVVREWIDVVVRCGWEERTILVGPGFARSRIFSTMRVKAAPGNYMQVVQLLRRMLAEPDAG